MSATTVDGLDALLARLAEREAGASSARRLVALVGPPASGKSTLAASLQGGRDDRIVVPMDGFHLDNRLLDDAGLRAVKGSPATFDVAGLASLLERIAADGGPVHVPLFDRCADLSRAAADTVRVQHRTVIVEGNYLLLDEAPWRELAPLFDLTIAIECEEHELERRLIQRWLAHGLDAEAARARALDNDLPNGRRVLSGSIEPHIRYRG